ncbi:hypothetical protein BVRB_1g002740 [Beta vulgaris subsp. vulgaris]|nr:hypothetical protein BVRB_1g002740 [Beta vulgaris subsp. vulgaris]
MGRAPCCSKVGLHRGPWTAREDVLLIKYIEAHGEGQWRSLPKKAGLLRCGKSCRLRWMNYLRPDIKRGNITPDEDDLIIRLHGLLGNRWSLIAGRLPGRTDNEIKNYWNTHLSKKLRSQGTDPNTHKKLSESELEKLAKNNYNKKRCKSSIDDNNNNKHTNYRSIRSKKLSDEVGEKTKIHLPKPVRVKSVISLTRNNSDRSLETNNNNVSTTSASSSQTQTLNQNYGLTTYDSENNIIMPWMENHASMGTNGFDDHMMMTIGSSYGDHDVNIDTMQPHHEVVAPDNNQQLEKLYEEYLQLIKVDHDHHYHDGDGDDDDVDGEAQLDSFTESFLI